MIFPDWTALNNPLIYTGAITLAVVASLETLLNLEAADKLDPHKRSSPPNRELWAQGIGNVVSGAIGGMPLTSVIVRSSVNASAGAKSKCSAIFHGVLLLFAVLCLVPLMNMIPLSALAAILILTGFKLTHPKLFKQLYLKGWKQFIPFIITLLAILLTDLLLGILIGLASSAAFILYANFNKG
jgi:Sulfate permease and related transporters (MFS superfamily)